MAIEVQLIAGTLPPPACYQSEQDRFEAYVAAITATISGGIQWEASATAPTDLTNYWLRLDANERPIEALKWSTADGVWLRWFDFMVFGSDTGAADAYAMTNTPAFTAVTAYSIGKAYTFIAANANTGASTLNVDGMGAKAIKKNVTEALVQNDIKTGQVVTVVYDGTNFQMVSRLSGSPWQSGYVTTSNTGSGTVLAATATLVGSLSLTLPSGKQWSFIRLVFSGTVEDALNNIRGFEIRVGATVVGFVNNCPASGYTTNNSDDQVGFTMIAEGVPTGFETTTPLQFDLYAYRGGGAAGGDDAANRKMYAIGTWTTI